MIRRTSPPAQTGRNLAIILLAALSTGGCVGGRFGGFKPGSFPGTQTADTTATLSAPASSPPAPSFPASPTTAATSAAQPETRYLFGMGMVQGSPQALAGAGSPLQAQPGQNRAVEPCRSIAWAQAQKLGAQSIEAASAGPERVDRRGKITAPVRVRITYPTATGTEVREAVMTCTVDGSGRIYDARS